RSLVCDSDTTSLPDRVAMNSLVMPDDTTVRVNNLARARQTFGRVLHFEITIDKARVITIWNETDLLRLLLLRNAGESMLPSRIASFGFRHLAEREQRARQLCLRQFPEKVRL